MYFSALIPSLRAMESVYQRFDTGKLNLIKYKKRNQKIFSQKIFAAWRELYID